jgi:hypothetical protein
LRLLLSYQADKTIKAKDCLIPLDKAAKDGKHECIEGELDMAAWWVFWAFITFADGRTAAGEAAKVFVWNEGFG